MLLIFTLCTAISIFSAIIFTSMARDAEIINLSGSLRMQSYRLAYDIAANQEQNSRNFIEKYDSVLYSDALKSVTNWHSTDEIKNNYFQVIRQWESIKEKIITHRSTEILPVVPGFVDVIDEMVMDIQSHSECKLRLLIWAICIGAIFVGLIVSYFVHYINRKVVTPIIQLSQASQSIRQGNFDIDLDYSVNNEIGELSTTFYRMADKVRDIYSGLEQSIAHHNHSLERAVEENHLLTRLSMIFLSTDHYQSKLEEVVALLYKMEAITSISIEWQDTDSDNTLIASQGDFSCQPTHALILLHKERHVGRISYQSESKLTLLESVTPIIAKYLHSLTK